MEIMETGNDFLFLSVQSTTKHRVQNMPNFAGCKTLLNPTVFIKAMRLFAA